MSNVTEATLPGIGKKYTVPLKDGALVIVVGIDGHRELYHIKKGEDMPCDSITMTDRVARQVGAIIGGAYFKPQVVEDLELTLGELAFEWFKVEEGFPCIGKSIAELQVRQVTGASIIAILRQDGNLPNPMPNEMIHASDTLVVIGSRAQVQAFDRLMSGEQE
ncbi:MAG: cation:proton antiporter regulatory subunit [Deinococcus sp.]|nr:cation:proton antiporter regulatory subunit [Deinococcus sp.]